MPLTMQPKLLRALEESRVRPVGAPEEVPFGARILTATNRDLDSAVEDGRFREDLFFRINVIQIDVPPLRSRGTDALLLAQHFVTSSSNLPPIRARKLPNCPSQSPKSCWPTPGPATSANCVVLLSGPSR